MLTVIYDECCIFIVLQSIIMLSVVKLNVIMLSVLSPFGWSNIKLYLDYLSKCCHSSQGKYSHCCSLCACLKITLSQCKGHRYLRKDRLINGSCCLVCLISTISGHFKKAKNALEDVALVAGT